VIDFWESREDSRRLPGPDSGRGRCGRSRDAGASGREGVPSPRDHPALISSAGGYRLSYTTAANGEPRRVSARRLKAGRGVEQRLRPDGTPLRLAPLDVPRVGRHPGLPEDRSPD
jgi:hypothetical protein